MSRIALLSPVSRRETLAKIKSGESTDNVLFGLNYISGVEYVTLGEYEKSSILARMPRFVQALFLIPHLLRYDFVVAQDNLLIGYIVSRLARLFRRKTQWLFVAMSSCTLIRRHKSHSVRLYLLKKFWASYARIVCISSEQIADFTQLGIPRKHLTFIPYGVDAAFFQAVDTSHEEELIVSVGRDAGRDYPTLLKAAEHSPQQFCIVAGVKNIPPGTTIPPNVSVRYNRSIVEVRELFAQARLVVVVSKNIVIPDGSDCSGQTVILEALAAGKPVIATYRPWIADYLMDGENLLVVPPNDADAIRRAIESLWNDTGKRKRLAESGHQKVLARYTTKAFSDALLKLMHSL